MNCKVNEPQLKTMFFSGHRPLPGQLDIAHPQRQEIRKYTYNAIMRAHVFGGFNTFYTGLAQGFDMDAALAVIQARLELKGGIYLIGARPFADFSDEWSPTTRKVLYEIIDQCDQLVDVCEPGYDRSKYMKRNMYMVDNSLEGICLWKGGKGGTYNTIRYCLQQNKRVVNLLQYDVQNALK